LLPPAPVACAVNDAIDWPITELPVTPEDVLAAIAEGEREHRRPKESTADLIRFGSHHRQENKPHG
jgi:hypothetical protein